MPAARLTRANLAESGYNRASFSDLQLGVSVPEACVYVARELEQGFRIIARELAQLCRKPTSTAVLSETPPREIVMRTQVLLRIESAPDRHALNIEPKTAHHERREEITREDHTGRLPLRSLDAKIAVNLPLAGRLQTALGLNIEGMFR
jgi:hypothetical protein